MECLMTTASGWSLPTQAAFGSMFALRSVGTGQSIDVLRQVRATLAETADVPVEVEYYDGATTRTLHPMHIDVRAIDGRPSAVVITVA